MIDFAARFAGAATLALAALPIAALATAAHAAPATVRIADLDLNSPHGQAAYQQRVDRAAIKFCKAQPGVATRVRAADDICVAAVREERSEKFVVAAQAQRAARSVYATR